MSSIAHPRRARSPTERPPRYVARPLGRQTAAPQPTSRQGRIAAPGWLRSSSRPASPIAGRAYRRGDVDDALHSLSRFRVHPRIRVVERLAFRTTALPDLPDRRPGHVVTTPARAVRDQDTRRGERGEVPRGRLVGNAGAPGVSAAADPIAECRVEHRIQPALG